METLASSPLTLAEQERELLVDLLDRELKNLPIEIHHTRTSKFKDRLKERMHLVEGILERLGASDR
jgi:hypothetical protein